MGLCSDPFSRGEQGEYAQGPTTRKTVNTLKPTISSTNVWMRWWRLTTSRVANLLISATRFGKQTHKCHTSAHHKEMEADPKRPLKGRSYHWVEGENVLSARILSPDLPKKVYFSSNCKLAAFNWALGLIGESRFTNQPTCNILSPFCHLTKRSRLMLPIHVQHSHFVVWQGHFSIFLFYFVSAPPD